jgi:predicted phage tail protein|tara:strand:+ start:29 stop:547 length:519 start_codon:yes stop_codon:yes gene_type:complete
MTEVFLHGILEKKFREKYLFSLNRFEEVMSAMECVEPRFRQFLAQNFDSMEFSILCDGKVVDSESECLKSCPKRIDLVPAAKGSLGPFATFLIMLFINVGIAIIQAASSVPKPEMDNNSEQSVKTKSYEFQGEANVQKQGKPVPVGYGRLRVGSYVIGAQTWNRNLFNQVKS